MTFSTFQPKPFTVVCQACGHRLRALDRRLDPHSQALNHPLFDQLPLAAQWPIMEAYVETQEAINVARVRILRDCQRWH